MTLYFQVVKDSQLYMVVGSLVFVDIVIMTTWQVVDPFYRETKTLDPFVSILIFDIFLITSKDTSRNLKVFDNICVINYRNDVYILFRRTLYIIFLFLDYIYSFFLKQNFT